jgi:hypothetical protein
MTISNLLANNLTEMTGLTVSEIVNLLNQANKELTEKKVPNAKRGPKNIISRGLRITEDLDQMLEALTKLAKFTGELEPFEKKNDLIRHLINKQYKNVFGPMLGRKGRGQ